MGNNTIWAPLPKRAGDRIIEPWQTLGARRVSLDDPESVEIFRTIYARHHQDARAMLARQGAHDHNLSPWWLEPFDVLLRRTQPHLTPCILDRFSQPDGYFLEYHAPGEERGICGPMWISEDTGKPPPETTHSMKYYGSTMDDYFDPGLEIVPGCGINWYDISDYEYDSGANLCFKRTRDLLFALLSTPGFSEYNESWQRELTTFADWFDYWVTAGHHIRHEIPDHEDMNPPFPV